MFFATGNRICRPANWLRYYVPRLISDKKKTYFRADLRFFSTSIFREYRKGNCHSIRKNRNFFRHQMVTLSHPPETLGIDYRLRAGPLWWLVLIFAGDVTFRKSCFFHHFSTSYTNLKFPIERTLFLTTLWRNKCEKIPTEPYLIRPCAVMNWNYYWSCRARSCAFCTFSCLELRKYSPHKCFK